MTAKKCTEKRDNKRAKLFCQSKPIAFLPFSLPSSSSLLKVRSRNETRTIYSSCQWYIFRLRRVRCKTRLIFPLVNGPIVLTCFQEQEKKKKQKEEAKKKLEAEKVEIFDICLW